MNFTNGLIFDEWSYEGYFKIEIPNSFTMPDHDIFLNYEEDN